MKRHTSEMEVDRCDPSSTVPCASESLATAPSTLPCSNSVSGVPTNDERSSASIASLSRARTSGTPRRACSRAKSTSASIDVPSRSGVSSTLSTKPRGRAATTRSRTSRQHALHIREEQRCLGSLNEQAVNAAHVRVSVATEEVMPSIEPAQLADARLRQAAHVTCRSSRQAA